MLIFSGAPASYRRTGLVLLCAQFSLFAAGLPPFQTGIWVQTEPVMTALFACAALNALWLAAGFGKRWLAISGTTPLFTVLVAWIVWQFIPTLLAPFPWRSWFGPPETGEGMGWYIALLLLVLLAIPLWTNARTRYVLLAFVLGNLVIQCALHLLNPADRDGFYSPDSWAPAQFPAYLAFIAAYVWIASASERFSRRAGWYCALIVLVYIVLYISHNKSANLLIAAGMTVCVLICALGAGRRFFYAGRRWRITGVILCALPLAWVSLSLTMPYLNVQKDSLGLLAALSDRDDSMGSRVTLNQVGVSTIQHEPLRLLTGGGWGRFTDDILKYALVDDVSAFAGGVRRPNWFLVDGNAFHSHNQPLEALLSLGLPGMVLWFAIPMIALWRLPKALFWQVAPMLVATSALGGMWFELPQCVPYHALALAALCVLSAHVLPKYRSCYWAAPVLLALAASMAVSAQAQYTAMEYGEQLRDLSRTDGYDDDEKTWMESDIARGGDRLRATATNYVPWAIEKSQDRLSNESIHDWYGAWLDAQRDMAKIPGSGARASYAWLWMNYNTLMLLGDDAGYDDIRHTATQTLEDSVMATAKAAPLRDDIAAPFLMSLPDFTGNDRKKEEAILQQLLAIAPNHRGAQWVLGNLWLHEQGHEEAGRALLKKAVSAHVERVYPVTNAELMQVK